MKRLFVVVALVTVLLIGGGASLVGGEIAAAKSAASPPGGSKDTWRTEWVNASWNDYDFVTGIHNDGYVNAQRDLQAGTAYLYFSRAEYVLVNCGEFTARLGFEWWGSAPADVDVRTSSAHAHATVGLHMTRLMGCEPPESGSSWTVSTVSVDLTGTGDSYTYKSATCFEVIGGEICTTDSSVRKEGVGEVLEGFNFDQRVQGWFGRTRGSQTFIPY